MTVTAKSATATGDRRPSPGSREQSARLPTTNRAIAVVRAGCNDVSGSPCTYPDCACRVTPRIALAAWAAGGYASESERREEP
jgi:hypothetical protein